MLALNSTPPAVPPAGAGIGQTASKTVTDTVVGSHTHTIIGYSLVKGIGDGEPIASERFTVGGHEWVLLFYPDGKRSSSTDALGEGGAVQAAPPALPAPVAPGGLAAAAAAAVAAAAGAAANAAGGRGGGAAAAPAGGAAVPAMYPQQQHQQQQPGGGQQQQQPPFMGGGADDDDGHGLALAVAGMPQAQGVMGAMPQPGNIQLAARPAGNRRDTVNEYAALFVALIGEGPNPQGIVNTSEGKVVRAFHRFTLVDQGGEGRDLTKGRTRDAGAVKISCARQDPNARNCHGYRKFVKRAILEDPSRGFLKDDTIIIKYTIELVVSTGGALSRTGQVGSKAELIKVPPPCLGPDMAQLLASGNGADCTFTVEGEDIKVHKIILEARSMVFAALLNSPMREGAEGRVHIADIKAPVFHALLSFVYTDSLPEQHDGPNLDVAMAQHLLVAADRYQLVRLRRICERRLCETVDVETVATTLTLAEQNHGEELKKVCLDFVSRNLSAVMASDSYDHMTRSCPQLQAEILTTIASGSGAASGNAGGIDGRGAPRGNVRIREVKDDDNERRQRQRRD